VTGVQTCALPISVRLDSEVIPAFGLTADQIFSLQS